MILSQFCCSRGRENLYWAKAIRHFSYTFTHKNVLVNYWVTISYVFRLFLFVPKMVQIQIFFHLSYRVQLHVWLEISTIVIYWQSIESEANYLDNIKFNE